APGCETAETRSSPSNAMRGSSSVGAPARLAVIDMRCGPSGVFFRGAALVQLRRTSSGSVPGHSIVIVLRFGGWSGGMTVHAVVLPADRAARTPRGPSEFDHAAARYQTRFHDPVGVSTPVATVM